MYLGSWAIDNLLTFPANTHTPTTGAATDADAVPAYRVYEDETGTAILTGNMAKLDDANTTGFYSEQITLSAANGFEKGKCYTIYIAAAVGSVTGTMAHTFQIEAEVDANTVSGVVPTVTNLTNAPTNGDLTATMINSVTTAAAAATPTVTLANNALTAAALALDAVQEIADMVLKRGAGNVDAASPETHSLYELIEAAFESAVAGTTWTIKRTDGSTPFNVRTVTTDASAEPIIAVT